MNLIHQSFHTLPDPCLSASFPSSLHDNQAPTMSIFNPTVNHNAPANPTELRAKAPPTNDPKMYNTSPPSLLFRCTFPASPAVNKAGSDARSLYNVVSTTVGKGFKPRTLLATTLPAAWKLSKPIATRSMVGKPIYSGTPPPNPKADGSPGFAGDSLVRPWVTRVAAVAVTSIWKVNEAARTQRLRSPKVRWKAEMRPAPRMKLRIAVRDLVQASEGLPIGRELTPRARKMVLPVCG